MRLWRAFIVVVRWVDSDSAGFSNRKLAGSSLVLDGQGAGKRAAVKYATQQKSRKKHRPGEWENKENKTKP